MEAKAAGPDAALSQATPHVRMCGCAPIVFVCPFACLFVCLFFFFSHVIGSLFVNAVRNVAQRKRKRNDFDSWPQVTIFM